MDCGPGGPWFKSRVGANILRGSIDGTGLTRAFIPFGEYIGIRAAEHKGCNWGMQIDWWLQPRAVFGQTFSPLAASSGICLRNKVNSIAWLYWDGCTMTPWVSLHYMMYLLKFNISFFDAQLVIFKKVDHPTNWLTSSTIAFAASWIMWKCSSANVVFRLELTKNKQLFINKPNKITHLLHTTKNFAQLQPKEVQ